MSLDSNNIKQEKLSLLPEYNSNNPDTHEKIICDFIIKETLGKGAFGLVKLAINSQTGEKVAIKVINESKIPKDQRLHFYREIEILKNIKHPNIIRLFSHITKEKQLYLITEYIKGIELFQYISLKKKVEESEACIYFQQIICGLEYLHKMGIAHRDIKTENILVDHYLKEIKIIDFGLSNKYSDKSELLSTLCGSPLYAAPEVLIGKGYKPRPVDIWSAGIVLYFMLSGKLPFQADSDEELYKKIIEAKIIKIKGISKEANDLIKQILNPNPRKRLSIAKIKKHQWFNLFNNNNFKNINYYGLFVNKYVMPVDEEIVEEIKNKFNISDIEIRRDILENKLNDITTLYYLFVFKKEKEGIKSISDFKNEDFRKYIKDENNSLKNYGNDINKVIKMRKKGIEYENKMKQERADSKGGKENSSLVKVNSEDKNSFFKELSPKMKNSKFQKSYTKNNSRVKSPKIKNSEEKSEISNLTHKKIRNDKEIENIKYRSVGKCRKVLIKSNTDNSNYGKKNNDTENSQKKTKNNNPNPNTSYKNNNSENKIINSKIKIKTNINKINLTYTKISPDKKILDSEIVNKKNKSDKKNNSDNKNKKNEIKEKEIIFNSHNNERKEEKNSNNIDSFRKISKNKSKEKNSSEKKDALNLSNEKKIKMNINFNSVRISPKRETHPVPLESIKESKEKEDLKKNEINIKKISNLKLVINNNNKQKSNAIRENYLTNYNTPKREENIMIFKKQNTGLIYKKGKEYKDKNNFFKKNIIRKNRMEEMIKSNINNTDCKNNRNKCLTINSVENSKIKNKDYSTKKYLNTEKDNNEEEKNNDNQKEMQRYLSTDIIDNKKRERDKSKKKNILTQKNSSKKLKNHYSLSKSNIYMNNSKNKLKADLLFSLPNNLNFNTDYNVNINNIKDNNLNEFIDPFDLNSIFLKKKGQIKEEFLEKIEKKKIKHKKLGNYLFVIELKKDISIEVYIEGNKGLLFNNIGFLKIKKIKGSTNSICNCLKKIL
jgi:5'-AMP-activated protein kinase catalytic alpha subunit